MNPFQRKPINQPRQNENCRIRVKETAKGREIEFRGKYSKEEIEIAKSSLNFKEGTSAE